jgi:hypothetical protein
VTRRLLAALSLLVLLAAPAARASVEEFSSYDLLAMEGDDENFLDRWLTRVPNAWDHEFAAAPNAFRTSQGCYTSGEWYMRHDLKARATIGKRSYLDIGYLLVSDDLASWEWLRLDFRWQTQRSGTFGFRFQPSADKSRQDFAALWDWGAPGDPLQVGATFTLEDAFNTLWEFRQDRVGDHNEPYRAHPVEPALRIASEGKRHRVELSGKWLTPLRVDIRDPDPSLNGTYSLLGSKAALLAQYAFARWETETRFETEQVRSSETSVLLPGDGKNFRRRWLAEAAVRRSFARRWVAEARGAYQDRAQHWRPPLGPAAFRALDRGVAGEVAGELRAGWRLRAGLMHDRVGVARRGDPPGFTWGTRTESRAYLGLEARFGRVRVQGIEGIELDNPETYEVTFHHDKGFLQLQAVF